MIKMLLTAKKGHLVMLNIILNILVTTYEATFLRSAPISSISHSQSGERIPKKNTNNSQAKRACKEGHPNWKNNETATFCDRFTCKNNCGKSGQCSCALDCFHYGDCCPDFTEFCSNILTNKTKILDINSSDRDKYECVAINRTMFVYLVSSCDLAHHASSLEVLCKTLEHDADEILPQTPAVDPETGVVYKNIDCARCNNVKEPKLWAIETVCEKKILTDHDMRNPDMNFIKKILTSKSCFLKFIAPNYARVRSCLPTEYECPSCANETLRKLCATFGLQPVQAPTDEPNPVPGIVYHNKFCWFCANPTNINRRACRIYIGYRSPAQFKMFSFQILADISVDSKRNLNVRPSWGIQSVEFELECKTKTSCIAVSCPDGYMKNGERCIMKGKLVQTILSTTALEIEADKHIEIMENLLEDTFIPTGYIDGSSYFESPEHYRPKIIMRFNVSFPKNSTNLEIHRNMTNKYETFLMLAEEGHLSQMNMTYEILPEPILERNSTASVSYDSIWPLFIAIIIMTFVL